MAFDAFSGQDEGAPAEPVSSSTLSSRPESRSDGVEGPASREAASGSEAGEQAGLSTPLRSGRDDKNGGSRSGQDDQGEEHRSDQDDIAENVASRDDAAPFTLEHPPAPPPTPEPKPPAKDRSKPQEEASQSPFSLTVGQVYDGPFDLLLDLVRKQNIDIYDIPIARITAQFLEYTHHLKQADVDAAGEFIYVASLLIHIKSKTLLPRDPSDVTGADPEDPRRELVERLLEHERFKAAAQMLMQKQQIEDATWSHPGLKAFLKDEGEESTTGEREIAADTVDLVRVFQDILQRLRERPIHKVDEDSVTVAQMIDFVKRRLLLEDKPISLRRMLSNTRSERALICTFLAMLELVRLQAIVLRQPEQFTDILVKKTDAFEQVMTDQAQIRDDWD